MIMVGKCILREWVKVCGNASQHLYIHKPNLHIRKKCTILCLEVYLESEDAETDLGICWYACHLLPLTHTSFLVWNLMANQRSG